MGNLLKIDISKVLLLSYTFSKHKQEYNKQKEIFGEKTCRGCLVESHMFREEDPWTHVIPGKHLGHRQFKGNTAFRLSGGDTSMDRICPMHYCDW